MSRTLLTSQRVLLKASLRSASRLQLQSLSHFHSSSPFHLEPQPHTSHQSSSTDASSIPSLSTSAYRRHPPPSPSPPPSPTPTPTPASTESILTPAPRVLRRRITSVDQLPEKFGKNQFISIPEAIRKDLDQIVAEFKAPIRYAFAYGSAVFKQAGYSDTDKPLLDFVFAVSHPSHWHAINMQQNPSHYSLTMRILGSDAVAWMQEKGLGAGVWFNIDVEVHGKIVKYGVISIDALCRDMLDWETLYISGRTQKPVKILHDDARVRLANQVNLTSALRTSLLLLPESFTEIELFTTIASLSYIGDFRMHVGENPNKVSNIVMNQLDPFRSLYGGLLKSFWKTVYVIGEVPSSEIEGAGVIGKRGIRKMRQDIAVAQRAALARRLPRGLKEKVGAWYERKWNLSNAVEAGKEGGEVVAELDDQRRWERIVADDEFQTVLRKSIAQIVGRPTFTQSLKGILSAGPVKSLKYIGPKLRKKWWPVTSADEIQAP